MGLSPKYYEMLLGKRVIKAIKQGTPMSWDLIINDHSENSQQ
jgi:N-acetylneuraminate synthase